MTRVLISGAGIAGCCLAWWLERYGYQVTLVEKAPEPRRGGYVIDFWGLGYEVAERMGIIDVLKPQDLVIHEMYIVDAKGKKTSGISQEALRDLTHGHMMSLPRSAVAMALYEAVKDHVDARFSDSIADLRQDASGVDVRFESGKTDRFDLVFGADGLHSVVRALAFDEHGFERFLGYYAAAFTAPGYPKRTPHVYVMHGLPGRGLARITLKEDASLFLLLFAGDMRLDLAHDPAAQKAELQRLFKGGGWESAAMLKALDTATDLYFDRMSQIEMPQWCKGRVALLGDACACPSLLAGEGSSMAMAEAYILAGELHAAAGDHAKAFQAYEHRLQPFVQRKQKAARGFAASFVPKSAFGLWFRDAILNLITALGLTSMAFRGQLNDPLVLPAY